MQPHLVQSSVKNKDSSLFDSLNYDAVEEFVFRSLLVSVIHHRYAFQGGTRSSDCIVIRCNILVFVLSSVSDASV